MLQLIYYINIKFQSYQDIFVAQERHRIKRKSNDSESRDMTQNETKFNSRGRPATEDGEKSWRKLNFNASAERNEGVIHSDI